MLIVSPANSPLLSKDLALADRAVTGTGKWRKTIITDTHDLEFVEQISKRAIDMDEDQMIKKDGNAKKVLDNLELLLYTNLIHEHIHFTESLS